MNKFEDLPANVRMLMLAKLAIVLRTHRCANLYELAKRQHIDVTSAWRQICRLSKQPICTVPDMGTRPQ